MLKSMLTHLRETSMREFEGDEAAEAGFTLIELMVVLLIIAILLAIAIPTFLGVANSAGDRAAQSNLTNALTEAKAMYQNSADVRHDLAATADDGRRRRSRPRHRSSPGCRDQRYDRWVQHLDASNCVSEQVVDASAAGDGQGIELGGLQPQDPDVLVRGGPRVHADGHH